ncbi:MAG: cytochrome c3 family protein, partial [Planctomycetaceae bacterium]|nr:cytochrome c3 family protein [Planctomycetaceae bacterium]
FSMDMLGVPIQLTERFHITFDQDQENIPQNISPNTPQNLLKEMSFEEIVSRFSILSPLPDSCVPNGEVTILCTWDLSGNSGISGNMVQNIPFSNMLLKVDNIPILWDVQFGKNTWLAQLRLEPGVHNVQTSVFEFTFFVKEEGSELQPPEHWKPFIMHKDINNPNRCQECHYLIDRSDDIVRKGHALTIGQWKGNNSCLVCHQNELFTKKHQSIAAPETDCQSCHRVHGTTEPEKLLKYPQKEFYQKISK